MKLILQEDVANLGKSGDLVVVKDGYGRNYLLPRGLAVVATEGNVKQVEHQRKLIASRRSKTMTDAKQLLEKLALIEVMVEGKLGLEGKLFGSVGAKEISESLQKSHGITLDRKKLHIYEPIRAVGAYSVEVRLGQGVVGNLRVQVIGI